MDLLWRALFSAIAGGLVWLLHRDIGPYPQPLPKSDHPRSELGEALLLWAVAVVVPMLRMFLLTPWLSQAVADRTLLELVYAPLLSLPYVVLPLFIVLKRNRWTAKDLGFTWKPQSWSVAAFAVSFGLLSGIIAFVADQAVIGSDPIPAGALVLLLYNNDFMEEFFHRGVIQSKLERALGQRRAVLWGGILFGLTHVAFDISTLLETGIPFVLFAVLLQTMLGWLLGIIYIKTRSLWPGIACHYLVNWLPSILVGLLG